MKQNYARATHALSIDVNSVLSRKESEHTMVLAAHNPDASILAFDRVPRTAAYHAMPNEVRAQWKSVTDQFGQAGFEAFQHVTLLRLIRRFGARSPAHGFADSIHACFERSFSRIVESIENRDFDDYRSDNDILRKDLALCRLKVFPAGAQVVEPSSSFHRSMLFSGGLGQSVRMARLLFRSGGNKRWYQIHTHLNELEDFSPAGWDACYVRIADMMLLHPEIRGMWGGSWYYDPALESVSPHLTYLRTVPAANGAEVFYSNIDIDSGALSTSKTRKNAYERGAYIPRAYALIWPREQIIRWAASVRHSLPGRSADNAD